MGCNPPRRLTPQSYLQGVRTAADVMQPLDLAATPHEGALGAWTGARRSGLGRRLDAGQPEGDIVVVVLAFMDGVLPDPEE